MKTLLCAVLTAALLLTATAPHAQADDFIKWVDFDVPATLMRRLIDLDRQSFEDASRTRVDWIELLAYLGAKCGGSFRNFKEAHLKNLLAALDGGQDMSELGGKLKTFGYYYEVYSAVLGGLVGEYEVDNGAEGMEDWQPRYGLRAYSPIAKTFPFSHFDDFGTGRNYGYARRHLGHDLMAATGTPVIAAESGVVEEIGWNRYGGWRLGIRSFDGLRYWYYAHMRQNRPYAQGLARGQVVMAGDVIGYVGRTGYSFKENTNGIKQSHLHWGLQIIFDPSQKDGSNQIWIDMYELTKLLESRKSETVRDPDTKEHTRAKGYREAVPEGRFVPPPLQNPL
ncbi:MAG: M23 family metallopeptidase [Oscillospiraceae bacterium]|jgi:murein DD-endopeptidase MepM/ murein hydrolase activator NlpD|nr:M23 family metallopeptidase [Oscillospiraceae bacterium]